MKGLLCKYKSFIACKTYLPRGRPLFIPMFFCVFLVFCSQKGTRNKKEGFIVPISLSTCLLDIFTKKDSHFVVKSNYLARMDRSQYQFHTKYILGLSLFTYENTLQIVT